MEKDGMDFVNQIIHGDCEDVLKKWQENAVDLIFTSPPYADRRANTYGGVKPGDYVDWFLPKAEQFLRVLKPTGTFILNIKERVVNGETPYVCHRIDFEDERARLVVDRRIYVAQEKFLSGKMAQSLSRFVGETLAV